MSILHDHSSSQDSVGPFQGPPKTMFFFGFFAGIALCSTLGLLLLVSSIASGKGLTLDGGSKLAAEGTSPTPTAPAPTPTGDEQPQPSQPVKPVDEKTDHILGPKDAKVTLIEYSDFECPFCSRHYTTIKQLMQDYSKDIRFIYRHYPLSFHPNSQKLAEGSECAAELGGNTAFFKYHDKVFEEMGAQKFTPDRIVGIAKDIGLDEAKFKSCVDSGKYVARVNQDLQEGSAAGVGGTPGTFVNGELVEGALPLDRFKSIIDSILKK